MTEDGQSALIFAFKNDPGEGRVLVRPRGLRSDLTYEVESADAGVLGTASGSALMEDGIEVVHGEGSLAHVLVLTAGPTEETPQPEKPSGLNTVSLGAETSVGLTTG